MKSIELTYNDRYNKDFYVYIEKDKFQNKIFHFVFYTNTRIEQKKVYIHKNKEDKQIEIIYPGNRKIIIKNVSRQLLNNETNFIYITHISKNYNKTPQTIKGEFLS
jgi:hypothetical protein